MPLDKKHSSIEEELRIDVRALVTSSSLAHEKTDRMDDLVRLTALLPQSRMTHWERIIRHELSFVKHTLAATDKTTCWQPFSPSTKAVERSRILNWIDLVDFDGHIRERTLRTLVASAPNGFFFALVVRRLNDWVVHVRNAAREAVPKIALVTNQKHIAEALYALLP